MTKFCFDLIAEGLNEAIAYAKSDNPLVLTPSEVSLLEKNRINVPDHILAKPLPEVENDQISNILKRQN